MGRSTRDTRRRWALAAGGLVLGTALGIFGLQTSVLASGWSPRAAECADACPDGTRKVSYEKVVTGQAAIITGFRCETYCEPILPCPPPNVPTVVATDAGNEFECAPLEGFSTIPAPNEIDFSFAVGWTPQ